MGHYSGGIQSARHERQLAFLRQQAQLMMDYLDRSDNPSKDFLVTHAQTLLSAAIDLNPAPSVPQLTY